MNLDDSERVVGDPEVVQMGASSGSVPGSRPLACCLLDLDQEERPQTLLGTLALRAIGSDPTFVNRIAA
jgi:hypothetical protein